jgi:hypothetical protein
MKTRFRSPSASVSDVRPRLAAALICMFVAIPGVASGQLRSENVFARPVRAPALDSSPGVAFLASAVFPGAGQYLLGEERWVPYVVLEAWAVLSYLDRRGDGRSLERAYKDLAWSVARRVSSGTRRDTAFQYYEALTAYDASGNFDVDPRQDGVQPELDVTTFNGGVWRLARQLYLPGGGLYPPGSAEYQRALAYYVRRAIPPEYKWAWGASRLEQQVYIDLIDRSDDAFREATQLLGVMVANHIVSAVDALVTSRLRDSGARELRLRIRGAPDSGLDGTRWSFALQVAW